MSRHTFHMFHGSHRWQGPPQIVPLRAGHAEHGPGVYFTTAKETAARYAKGGGKIGLFTIAAPRAWAHEVKVDLEEAKRITNQVLKGAKKKDVILWLEKRPQNIRGETLINLFVNRDAAHGEPGVALASFLVDRGMDATKVVQSGETWIVVLNPSIILSRRDATSGDPWDLDRSAIKSMQELATDVDVG